MALFKFRKAGDESSAAPRPPESIEAMRKRARHRLIGAGVLVLIGVVGFPLLFDTQPQTDRRRHSDRDSGPQQGQAADRARSFHPQSSAVSGPVTTAPAANPAPSTAPASPAAASTPAPVPETGPRRLRPRSKPKSKPNRKLNPSPNPRWLPNSSQAGRRREGQGLARRQAGHLGGRRRRALRGPGGRFRRRRQGPRRARQGGTSRPEDLYARSRNQGRQAHPGARRAVRPRGEADKAASKIKGLDLPAAILTL